MHLFKKNKKNNQEGSFVGIRNFLRKMGREPHVDWSLSVLATIIAVIALVTFGISKYMSFESSLEQEITASISKTSEIDTKKLETVLKKYENRNLLREEIMKIYSGPRDPSI